MKSAFFGGGPAVRADVGAISDAPAPAPAPFKADAPTDALVLPARTTPARVAIVYGLWHPLMVDPYCARVRAALEALDPAVQVEMHAAVGAGEIPLVVRRLLDLKSVHAVICVAVLLAGATHHMQMTATGAAVALAQLQVERNVPVLNGIVAAFTPADAAARTTGDLCTAAYLAKTALCLASPQ